MATQGITVISVAARDWLHRRWWQDYYPEDLPEDWALNYYANEFLGVVVPWRRWHRGGVAALRDWATDLPQRFRFLPEYPLAEIRPEVLAALLQNREHRIGAVIVRVEASLHPSESVLTDLRRGVAQGLVVMDFATREIDEAFVRVVPEALRWPRLCRADGQGPCAMVAIGGARKPTREVLEQAVALLKSSPATRAELWIIVEGEPPSASMLENAKTFAELSA